MKSSLDRLKEIIESYIAQYPTERSRIEPLLTGLRSGGDLWNRRNFQGHLSATIIVTSLLSPGFLLLSHRALGMDLPPGGHVDPYEAPEAAALRELAEETGIIDRPLSICLVDIDIHAIPVNPHRDEQAHRHFDFRYLAVFLQRPEVSLDERESRSYSWTQFSELPEGIQHALTKGVIQCRF